MLKNLVLIALLWFGFRGYGVDFQAYYSQAAALLAGNEQTLLMYGLAGALGMVVLSYLFAVLDWHTMMYVFAKLFFELSQFVVCLVSFVAVAAWFGNHHNLWRDLGLTGILPFVALFASCFSLRIFDFNYPVADKILANIILALVSGLIILGSAMAGIG